MTPSDTVGPYRLVELLGTGGMGEVWLATQSEPVRRDVAIKLVRADVSSPEVTARFAAEGQALALMEHPHIAKVYEVGETDAGRAYIVMELVRGEELTAWCDARSLDIEARLRLLIDVCRGVQHAHLKGRVHRDLKPSNVLVVEADGRAIPKIIDFGIAKDLEAKGRLHETAVGDWVGTFSYMSPEQAAADIDIDARSDVYSLGVVLYEMLSGVLPFDEGQMKGVAALAALVTTDPPAPSSRLASMVNHQDRIAMQRQSSATALVRRLGGDLDWITGRALEKDRERRYQTPNELADDLQRYLDHEPVLAGPPSRVYRMRKFVRRNRVGTVAALVTGVSLVTGLGLALEGRNRARESAAAARIEADRSAAINQFLQDALARGNPWAGGEREVTLVEALSGAVDGLDGYFEGQPLVAAEVRRNVGTTFGSLGRLDEALELHLAALNVERDVAGESSVEVAATEFSLATVYADLSRYDDAVALARSALETREARLGADHVETLETARRLAEFLFQSGDFNAAEAEILRVLPLVRALPDESELEPYLLRTHAMVLRARDGDYVRADELNQESLALERRLDGNSARLVLALASAGVSKMNLAEYEAAQELQQEAVALARTVFGDEHPTVAANLDNLANTYQQLGRFDEALSLLDTVYTMRVTALGEESEPVGRTLANMGNTLSQIGQSEQAIDHLERGIAILSATLGPAHPDLAIPLSSLSLLHVRASDFGAARENMRRAVDIQTAASATETLTYASDLMILGGVLQREGEYAAAEAELLRSLELYEAALEDGRATSAQGVLREVARLYDAWGRPEDAAPYWERFNAGEGG